MKNCPKCTKEVPSEFDICWNCNYTFATYKTNEFKYTELKAIDEIKPKGKAPKKIDCLRCQTPMKFRETLKFRVWFGFIIDKESFDTYICPNCDKVEFFAPSVGLFP